MDRRCWWQGDSDETFCAANCSCSSIGDGRRYVFCFGIEQAIASSRRSLRTGVFILSTKRTAQAVRRDGSSEAELEPRRHRRVEREVAPAQAADGENGMIGANILASVVQNLTTTSSQRCARDHEA
jgi:hypothetical protein